MSLLESTSVDPVDPAELSSRTESKDASPTPIDSPEPPPSYPSFSDLPPPRQLDGEHLHDAETHDIPPNSAIGRLSFAPATQTTIVTTTTTTTTDFPPFVMRAPRCTQELDPKLYPLASTPTPASIRNIKFDIGGKSVIFNEPDDAPATVDEVSLYYDGSLFIRVHPCRRQSLKIRLLTQPIVEGSPGNSKSFKWRSQINSHL